MRITATLWSAIFLAATLQNSPAAKTGAISSRPNVLLIITDDQGHGDLGFHGNPKIRTPHLDRLGRESAQFKYFYVSPVCAPTRASLLTGRYNYRTSVVDTYRGRALMHPDEVTLAEMLRTVGYRTGIFGKWHLGDHYPMRPIDQGFQEALVHLGGGIGQPSDPPGGTNYFDPILQHNGKAVKTKGYCSDVYTDAAIRFLAENRGKNFFVYLAFNAPHTPLQAPENYYQDYRKMNLAHGEFPTHGHPLPGQADENSIAKVYAMISNIDDNVGRLLAKLDELDLARETIVIFLTDNGPQGVRYNSGMLERKGNVHEGGIRVPCFLRWPGTLQAGRTIDRIAAHIDVTPTLLDFCGVDKPAGFTFDGVSLRPLLEGPPRNWLDRTLYFQWHRGDEPQLNRACAARSEQYKLVQPLGIQEGQFTNQPVFKLYDMSRDPLEMHDIARETPEQVQRMRRDYEAWLTEVGQKRGYAPPRIHLGAPQENPLTLTRQDWRGPRASHGPQDLGYWEVLVAQAGRYEITLRFAAFSNRTTAHFALGETALEKELDAGATACKFGPVLLPAGPARLEAWLLEREETVGVHQIDVKRLD